jgi:hypothetical protein
MAGKRTIAGSAARLLAFLVLAIVAIALVVHILRRGL